MGLYICPDCGLSVRDSDGSCGCEQGEFRVTFEFRSGSTRRRFFKTRSEAETAMNRFEDSNDPRRTGCICEVQDKFGRWCPHDGEYPFG